MTKILSGFKAALTPHNLGLFAGFVIGLAVLYAFLPALTPEGIATRFRG